MMVHECGEPQCHEIIPYNERYCPKHKAKHEQAWHKERTRRRKNKLGQAMRKQRAERYDMMQRDPAATAFYQSAAWRQVRDYVYSRDQATCQVCGNVVTDRKIVDHIVPRKYLSRTQALDTSNLWTLCYKDHYRKTLLEQSMEAKPNGETKLRHLDRAWWHKVLTEDNEEYKRESHLP